MNTRGTVTLPSGEVAQWHVAKRVLYVRHGAHEKSSDLGGFGLYPQALASILLSEIVLDTHAGTHHTMAGRISSQPSAANARRMREKTPSSPSVSTITPPEPVVTATPESATRRLGP